MCYSALKNLKQVILSNNLITEFPVMFAGLKNLDVLDLSRNKITRVPPAVKGLCVIELNLNQNQLSELASDIADCPRLKTLRLEENCLQISAISPRIMKESLIANLCLDGNLFSSKQLIEVEGYDQYMERYTNCRRKLEWSDDINLNLYKLFLLLFYCYIIWMSRRRKKNHKEYKEIKFYRIQFAHVVVAHSCPKQKFHNYV